MGSRASIQIAAKHRFFLFKPPPPSYNVATLRRNKSPMNDSPTPDFKPIFIGGSGRSGTTLLRTLLDRHIDLAMINEAMFFGTVEKRRAAGHDGLLALWQAEPECAGQGLDPAKL